MQYYNAPDSRKFTRMIKRDGILIFIIVTLSFLFFFLAPFIAYVGSKYGL
jgi:hypothetical protein